MSTIRDTVRQQRRLIQSRFVAQGGSLEDLARETRDPRALTYQAGMLLNGGADVPGRYRLATEAALNGAYDGQNQTFVLRDAVSGENIVLIYVIQSTGTSQFLAKTDSTSPVAGTFHFDTATNTVTVGTPPAAADGLLAVYDTKR
jgi:hypothetical protein